MSFKDELYDALVGHGVKYIEVDRDAVVKGEPSVAVNVYATDRPAKHEFTFSKANHMSAEHMAAVILSYLRNRA